jgi:hypothetical protein
MEKRRLIKQFRDNPWLGVVAVILPMAVSIVVFYTLPIDIVYRFTRENGLVEDLSAVGHFLTAACCLILVYKQRWRDGWTGAFIAFLFGCRELEFQERFTALSITKIRFYTEAGVPWMQKAVVLALIAFTVWVVARYLRRHAGSFVPALRLRRPYAVSVLSGMFLLGLSKFSDLAHRMVISLGVPLCYNDEIRVSMVEEFFELGVPLLFLVAVFQFVNSRHSPA